MNEWICEYMCVRVRVWANWSIENWSSVHVVRLLFQNCDKYGKCKFYRIPLFDIVRHKQSKLHIETFIATFSSFVSNNLFFFFLRSSNVPSSRVARIINSRKSIRIIRIPLKKMFDKCFSLIKKKSDAFYIVNRRIKLYRIKHYFNSML